MDLIASLLASLDYRTLITMFWFLVILETPRFLLAGVAVAVAHRRRQGRHPPGGYRVPAVSILLPCHNNAAGLVKTVASLREQTLQPLEIVAIDDGSSDRTAEVGRRLRLEGAVQLFLSTGLRGGKSAALNLGLAQSSGEIVICADADTTFDRDGIETLVRAFADPTIGAVGGNVGIRNVESCLLAAMQAVEYAICISLGRQISTLMGLPPTVSGAFAGFRREALLSVGGWEAGAGEDADLGLKLRRAGWRLSFAEGAWALTDAPTSIQGLFRQRLRWESDLIRLHLRKFLGLLSPWRRNFSLSDTLGAVDALVFSVGVTFACPVYLAWMVAKFGTLAVLILLLTTLVYAVIGTVVFVLATSATEGRAMARLLPYTLGYGIYWVFLLYPIRICACVDEIFFFGSYRSTFVPKRVLARLWRF